MNQESHLYSSFCVSVTRLLLTDFLAIKWTIIQYFISQARFHQLLLDTWCFGRYMNIHDRLTRLKNKHNLCSRRLEVVSERENRPARGVGRAESCSVVIKIHVSCCLFTADKFTCFGSINSLSLSLSSSFKTSYHNITFPQRRKETKTRTFKPANTAVSPCS